MTLNYHGLKALATFFACALEGAFSVVYLSLSCMVQKKIKFFFVFSRMLSSRIIYPDIETVHSSGDTSIFD